MYEIEKYEHDGLDVRICQDDDPLDPRLEWDHLGVMVCFHKRYLLGDKDHGYREADYDSWDEVYKAILAEEDPLVVYPLYLFDHSGITISIGKERFQMADSAGWDWGQVGFIFARKKDVRKEYNKKRISPKMREQVCAQLRAEVQEYDQYLTGDVYGVEVIDRDGEVLDSVWGVFGLEYARECGNEQAEYYADEKRKRPPTIVPAPVCARA